MKVIAMIPARLGSQRVPKKNLRLLNGEPLISYIIEAAKASNVFDEIYVNSEAEILGEIAESYGVRFYQRSEDLVRDETINDDFAHDFIQNVDGDILVQLLPTSPLITAEEIREFVDAMIAEKYDSLVSVHHNQIACVYDGKPVNFSMTEKHKSSQTMTPVQAYATVLMAWTYTHFQESMVNLGCAYHGGEGKTGYYQLKGLSTIDIDNEEDFALAEVALQHRKGGQQVEPEYYVSSSECQEKTEIDVPAILKRDGILDEDFEHENSPLVNIDATIASKDSSRSWCYRVVNTENNSATLISQMPGEGNRLHYHPDWNEWWYIIAGQWKWKIEGEEMIVRKGDVVFIERNKWHRITALGDTPSVRLAVSRDGVKHVYKQESDEAVVQK